MRRREFRILILDLGKKEVEERSWFFDYYVIRWTMELMILSVDNPERKRWGGR